MLGMASHQTSPPLILAILASVVFTSHAGSYDSKPNSTLNVIDSCWRGKANWASNRQALANCAVGFGKDAMGGKLGAIYIVTDPSDDPRYPTEGTLRYGVTRAEPLWIVFARDMVITLKNELMINSYKTIDGRGAKVEIAYGPCLTIAHVNHVIVHGLSIHDCKPGKKGIVMDSPSHSGRRQGSDGDAVDIFNSNNIWIDHCYLARCPDGLVDVIHGSTAITISNNYFTQHDKVMLLGHEDWFVEDKIMKVTVVLNKFGPGLVQRLPRVRSGYAHVANNMYEGWEMYAIGGSGDPTIFSEANYFVAPNERQLKQVTKREVKDGWTSWKWRSSRDIFMNGAYFIPSGYGSCRPNYSKQQSFPVADGLLVPALTTNAGPLQCSTKKAC